MAAALLGPPRDVIDITPHDSNLHALISLIYVGTAGNVSYIPAGQSATKVLYNVVAGMWHPIEPTQRILSTGTAATNIRGANT